ncbi:PleD family two-component system response regulator [Rhodoblastus acidophilus]|uniref:diguanylate cyclase n=1 Tax=Candidatus Rhodoblastus alkanivorans TaxID=2954117 RepID=A0ABS9ZAY2_9HYPH|nr:PleD family two-component system response regulator [Candidatus Rhodoblastus alkanivorans]MCI4677901.1 PleD family two-component system response regulator [Candidatus Rhodoblastus alkanivorans]MCI4683797.1 PleD family two-component system response regulator [Candidatus Rhodoblastus alkanivorans]MDI4641115.1 PleD family two-component system response regulator [Rhodoblastus acidophilus]
MTARVLVVDDVIPNLKLLEARLTAEYFDVVTATNGYEALKICERGECDIVLLDVMMPGMDGFEVCRRLKNNPATLHLPVVIVTALDETADRVRGLEAGADDFLTKPIDEIALIARVRSLARLKLVTDELRNRAETSASLGVSGAVRHALDDGQGGSVLLVEDRPHSAQRILSALRGRYQVDVETEAHQALFTAAEQDYQLVIVSLGLADFDGLRLCSQLLSLDRTRNTPLLIIVDLEDRQRILRGLDLGVNDYIVRPVDPNEIIARVRTQIRRKRYADALRSNVREAMELAVLDPLTGLNNRRYLETHLGGLLDQAAERGRPVAIMMLDVDHFKRVNDTYGHEAGDEVLKTFADRIRRKVRSADLMCRLGGEEFVVVMPDTRLTTAQCVGERIRAAVAGTPFPVKSGDRAIPITVSIGVADSLGGEPIDALLRRADQALYLSKNAGRNRVTATAA